MTITDVKISHHGRSVHAVMYLPDSAAPAPAVLMSHGYNGCKTDFDHGARRGRSQSCSRCSRGS